MQMSALVHHVATAACAWNRDLAQLKQECIWTRRVLQLVLLHYVTDRVFLLLQSMRSIAFALMAGLEHDVRSTWMSVAVLHAPTVALATSPAHVPRTMMFHTVVLWVCLGALIHACRL
jgi:hypothetical protein